MEENVLTRLLKWCESRVNQKEAMKKRFSLYLDLLSDQINFDIIKVTGTNGKGSVAAMLSSCLTQSQKCVGLFTSPHLISVNERFRINDETVSIEEMEAVALQLEVLLKKKVSEAGSQFTPSFFEVLILIAILLFSKNGVEIAIFEAGIGGANDSTSLLPAVVSVITSIGLDHQKQLGETLEEIAIDKTGIAPTGTTLLVNSEIPEHLKAVIKAKAKGNAVLVKESGAFISAYTFDLLQNHALATIDGRRFELEPSLPGYFQKQNLNLVIEVWLFLYNKGIVPNIEDISGVRFTKWEARFEVIRSKPTWILDAAHNPEAFAALIDSLNKVCSKDQRVLLFGNSEEKDFKTILKLIPAIADTIYFVDDFHKAIPKSVLSAHCDRTAVGDSGDGTIENTIPLLMDRHPDNIIVAAGSIFMVGMVRESLKKILQFK